jgi:hypothetical protein
MSINPPADPMFIDPIVCGPSCAGAAASLIRFVGVEHGHRVEEGQNSGISPAKALELTEMLAAKKSTRTD